MTKNKHNVDESVVLREAVLNAGKRLGMCEADIAIFLNINDIDLVDVISADSKAGVSALYLIRCYLGLHRLMGGDTDAMKLWLSGYNHGTAGIPFEQIMDKEGLSNVMQYIEAMTQNA